MSSGPATFQPNLFDPDDRVNAPVPFQLTARGRRLVDPTTPDLRVVEPGRVDRELEDLDGPTHARVRALRRAGRSPDDIATQVDLHPTTLAVFRATNPAVAASVVGLRPDVPSGVTSAPRSSPSTVDGARHPAARHDHRRGIDRGELRSATALALVAAVGEVDSTGLGVTTNRIGVAATMVQWLRRDQGIRADAVRVVLRVADVGTADLVAAAWADRLELGRGRVSTVPWRTAPGPRDVQAVVRVMDRELADRLVAAMADWPQTSMPSSG